MEKQLVKPLAEKEARRSRFSRSYIPPLARRVGVLDGERSTDGRGAEFAAFAVDERSGVFVRLTADDSSRWRKDAIVGCVYPARDEIFIKRGDKFFDAGLLLGKENRRSRRHGLPPGTDADRLRPADPGEYVASWRDRWRGALTRHDRVRRVGLGQSFPVRSGRR